MAPSGSPEAGKIDVAEEVSVSFGALAGVPKRGGSLLVAGDPGPVIGLDLSGLRYDRITIECGPSIVDALAPRFLRARLGSRVPAFEECRFDGLLCRWLDLGYARFRSCSFEDVSVRVASPTGAHFEDCSFSGRWEGNFSGVAQPGDPSRRPSFHGNDLRRLVGADYQRGIDLARNHILRLDGTQLVVWRHAAWLPQAVSVSRGDRYTYNRLTSLRGDGPLFIGQEWMVLEERETDPEVWIALSQLANSEAE